MCYRAGNIILILLLPRATAEWDKLYGLREITRLSGRGCFSEGKMKLENVCFAGTILLAVSGFFPAAVARFPPLPES